MNECIGTICFIFIGDVSRKNPVPPVEMEQSVPKRRHIKFRRRGITKKERIQHCTIPIYTTVFLKMNPRVRNM